MDIQVNNLLSQLPDASASEQFSDLLNCATLRIERIVSRGQITPETNWYEQDQHEWVLLLEGKARLQFEDREVSLQKGDYVHIAAGCRHRVSWTAPDIDTVWLAIFYL
ncbi:cupin domain-containing protein [Thaumasiovibrio sp. DFM-14]|uniref:cupin domain-containing protein n=1 Tax=Thaumasiovibrio sp. DFM-14 TaxID=3384792 RepID=UPI00399F10E9